MWVCIGLMLTLCGCQKKMEKPNEEEAVLTLSMYSEVEISQKVLGMIEEKTGIHLDVYYPEEGIKNSVEKMIAIGEIPDIIYTKTEGSRLVEAGVMMDTRYLLKDYAQNVLDQYENGRMDMYYCSGDSRVFFLPVPYGLTKEKEERDCVWLQYTMISEYGYEVPQSLYELGDLLRHDKKKNEEVNGEEKIGITFLCEEDTWLYGLSMAAGRIADGIEEQGQWIVDEDNGYEVTYKHTTKEEKEFFRWLNQMYTEGILDPDFATQTKEDYIEKIKKSKAVCLLDSSIYMQQGVEYLVEKEKFGDTYLAASIKMNQSQPLAAMQEGEKRGQGLGITTACKYPERAIEMIDYLFSSPGQECLRAVEENNESWERQREYEEGIADSYPIHEELEETEEKKYYAIDIQQCDYELDELTKQLDEIARTGLIQCIICGEDAFEETWKELQKNLQEAGVQRAEIMMTGKYQDYVKKE